MAAMLPCRLTIDRSSLDDPLSTKAEAIKEFMPELVTTTEASSIDSILREHGQRLRDMLREDLIAKTRGAQGVQRSSFKVVEEGVKRTSHITESTVQEKCQIRDQQGEVHQPTGKLRSSVGDSQGGRGSLKYIIYFYKFRLFC